MSDPIRFPAQLPYEKWRAVSNVFGLMLLGDWPGAQAAYNAQKGAIDDSIGAGNYWWSQFAPAAVQELPDCPGGSAIQTFTPINPGVIYTTRALADGGFSWSVSSGSFPLVVGVGDTSGSFTVAGGGTGASAVLKCKAGQWCSMALAQGVPQQSGGRYSIDSSGP